MSTYCLLKRRGFSLLELSVVTVIVSIVAVMGLEGAASYISYTAYQSTQDRMAAIDAALVRYRYIYGRLPCPAVLPLPITNAQYGHADIAAGCTNTTPLAGGISNVTVTAPGAGYTAATFPVTFALGGLPSSGQATAYVTSGTVSSIVVNNPSYGYAPPPAAAPTVDLTAGASSTAATATARVSGIRVGGVPVVDLQLPLSYAIDNYGSKILYYVTEDLTSTVPDTFKNSEGVIQVRSGPLTEPCAGVCDVETANAAYALISVGRDQRGGYSARGVLINNCIATAAFNKVIDAQNCRFEGTTSPIFVPATPAGVIYNSPFNNGEVEINYTDDLVVSRTKSEL